MTNHSTGPKTPEGKSRCRLNAYRHGLTGHLCVFTPEEQQAYEHHCKITLDYLAPVGDFELDCAQSIADDRWRLKRARSIEASTFALGMSEHSTADTAGHPEMDNALAQARTWRQDVHNLQLLTVYAHRIQRACDKNTEQLKAIQAERKEIAKEAMKQAKLLYQLAQAEGKLYRPEAYFITAPEVRESVFSAPEIAHEISRDKLLDDATNYHYDGSLPKKVEPSRPVAQASASVAAAGTLRTYEKIA